MNKYHITKKNYVHRVVLSIIIALIGAIVYLSLILDLEAETAQFNNDLEIVGLIAAFVVPLITSLIFGWIIMRRHIFYDDGEHFIIEQGLINRKQIKIPYKNINMVAIKRSLWAKLVKTSIVEIDTRATTAPFPEARLMLEKDYALVLKDFLERKNEDKNLILPNPNDFKEAEEKEEEVIYEVKSKDLFMYGLLKPNYLMVLVIVFTFISSIFELAYYFDDESLDAFSLFLIGISVLLIVVSVITIFMGLINVIIYYNYKLKIQNGIVEYEYGLFYRNSFKFKIKDINALYLTQSIGLRMFKQYNLQATTIGVGEFNNPNDKQAYESKHILPMASYEKTVEVLNLLNGKELVDEQIKGPERLKYLNFIVLPLLVPTIILLTFFGIFLVSSVKLYIVFINLLIVYLIVVIASFKRLNNHGYDLKGDLIIRKGSYTVKKYLVKKDALQEISFNENPIQMLMKIGKLSFRYRRLHGNIKLSGYTKEDFLNVNKFLLKHKRL